MRLTEKNKVEELLTFQKNNVLMTDNDYKELKLGQLEDIEDELGIDLITLFKALKNGIIDKIPLGNNFAYTNITPDRLSIEFKYKRLRKRNEKYYFNNYGKTWALTEEELK